MPSDLTLEGQVQAVLDEMLTEKLIPFALHVGKITKAENHYTIHFYDSRIATAEVELVKGQSLEQTVRTAVLARVANMSGPLITKRSSI
jgi:hypothetical protein